jgi:peroxiredoxin
MTRPAAPLFELPDVDGGTWSLSEARGRAALLVFLRHVY